MTISYNWLCDYLPVKPAPDALSTILTSVGLEVESLEPYQSVKGGLEGLVIGEVITCIQHPGADKLKLTKVNIGQAELLQIVCGAPNVAAGQKVIVATVGTTIHPTKGDPITMKVAKIRGEESHGMICAEDEIGLGESHAGIVVLPGDAKAGTTAREYFQPFEDFIYEIGLTPNHMDAMSHLGVARDVCAYLTRHEQKEFAVKLPPVDRFSVDNNSISITVSIEDEIACGRYSGVGVSGIDIKPSPKWMQSRLKAIGVRPISNIVDITNFVLHETGQPLHAYNVEKIRGNKILIKTLPEGSKFVTLDEKERTLRKEDLMICNAEQPICIAGVFGGLDSGVDENTKAIFLESAWFNPGSIRKTSFAHGLRTDAALHFEKGMDISGTVFALKRAALLMKEYAGGLISSEIVDEYPHPKEKLKIALSYSYLKKISGKHYKNEDVKKILQALGFDITDESAERIAVTVPYHKPDITIPADLAEEIMRIDGYDNIEIPSSIRISPSIASGRVESSFREKVAGGLVGLGFHEIFTNSITNSAYYSIQELETAVKMINSLSTELNVMRPSLLETGLESVAYNINRKNNQLKLFEFGKTYHTSGVGSYTEKNHLCLYVSGNLSSDSWKRKAHPADFFYLKGVCKNLFQLLNIQKASFEFEGHKKLGSTLVARSDGKLLLEAGTVQTTVLRQFDIRQPVFFADLYWDVIIDAIYGQKIEFKELPKQLPVYRDLAVVVRKSLAYEEVKKTVQQISLDKLRELRLFDIFESEKLGDDKKSLAMSFTFMDDEKTLTDKEIDGMMNKIIRTLEEKMQAEIRR